MNPLEFYRPVASNQDTTKDEQPTPIQKFKCVPCNKANFNSIEAVEQHQAALGHDGPISQITNEKPTEALLKQHNSGVGIPAEVRSQPQNDATSKATAPAATAIPSHNSAPLTQHPSVTEDANDLIAAFPLVDIAASVNDFTVLSPLEQDLIFKCLLTKCHSFNRLQAQGHILPDAEIAGKYPYSGVIERGDFRETPKSSTGELHQKRKAIVLDCEMVETTRKRSVLAFFCAADFLTGEVLIHNYVSPTEKVVDWISNISGVTSAAMAEAVASGNALDGWQAARSTLFEYINGETILIGQSLDSDLGVLGIYHSKVVDSAILTGEAVFPTSPSNKPLKRLWSLKKVAKELLDRDIQTGNNGHNCKEDTLTVREVVLWCLRNPELLKTWADNSREQHNAERKARRKNRKTKKKKKKKKNPSLTEDQPGAHSGNVEILRLSDFDSDLWPTDYDPWSD